MEIHLPDPAFTSSRRSHENFGLAVRLALGFVALLWMILLLGQGLDLEQFGVRPRDWHGLIGILAAPLLHGGFKHLLDNSIPLVVVGTAMLYLYPKSSLRVLPVVYRALGSSRTGIGSGLDESHFFLTDDVTPTTPGLFAVARRPRR